MQKLLSVSLILFCLSNIIQAQKRLVGFSESGIIDSPNSGGAIWEMDPNNFEYNPIYQFSVTKPYKRPDRIVFGADGYGYGTTLGVENDYHVLVIYRYDFTLNKLDIVRTFWGKLAASQLIYGADNQLYLFIKGKSTLEFYRISTDGLNASVIDAFPFYENGNVSFFEQMPDDKFIACIKTSETAYSIYSGETTNASWALKEIIPLANLSRDFSPIVKAPDGTRYGLTYDFNQVRLFSISTDYTIQVTYNFQADELTGYNSSLNIANDSSIYILTGKSDNIKLYRMLKDNEPPNLIYSNGPGYVRGGLSKGTNGNFYFHVSNQFGNSQTITLMRTQPTSQLVEPIHTSNLSIPYNSYLTSFIFHHPQNNHLYYWRDFDYINQPDEVKFFSCNQNGSGLSDIYTMPEERSLTGHSPKALILGSDHKIYGILSKGGAHNYGSIFSMDSDGSNFTVLFNLFNPGNIPAFQKSRIFTLFEGSDGMLYGSVGDGRLFRMMKNGAAFTILKSDLPPGVVVSEMEDGKLYWGDAQLWKMDKDGSNTTLLKDPFILDFVPSADFSKLYRHSNGNFIGVGSYSESDGWDYYTYGFAFEYQVQQDVLIKRSHYYFQNTNVCKGVDEHVYFAKGGYNPIWGELDSYEIGCPNQVTGVNSYIAEDTYFQRQNGDLVGKRNQNITEGSIWMPMIWDSYNGDCVLSKPWEPALGYFGHFAFEQTIGSTAVTDPEDMNTFVLAPNPAQQHAKLVFTGTQAEQIEICIIDPVGRVLWQMQQQCQAGENQIEFPAQVFSQAGCYWVSLRTPKGTSTQKLVVY